MNTDQFVNRHIGPSAKEVDAMLASCEFDSIESLIAATIPANIRLNEELDLPSAMTEMEYAKHISDLASKNEGRKSYIGLGYAGTFTPPVIQRNILENPGWYTAYTPYQAEISQGRMEALLNFQTMVCDLTGLPLANASLLDESTAAAEAMMMLFATRDKTQKKEGRNKFFASEDCLPQTLSVLKNRSSQNEIELVIGSAQEFTGEGDFFGALFQYPNAKGELKSLQSQIETIKEFGCRVVVACDLLALALITPPGEFGAEIAVGNTQRFGVPMGFGGPHAAFFATKEEYKRNIPGRIIGLSVDKDGDPAMRMALQTREQHIKRDRATSNICTAQALLAIMAGMYAVWHGPKGIKQIAENVHLKAVALNNALAKMGLTNCNQTFFDTLCIQLPSNFERNNLKGVLAGSAINLNTHYDCGVGITVDETTTEEDLNQLVDLFSKITGEENEPIQLKHSQSIIPEKLVRTSEYLMHPRFNKFHSETEMMRYIKRLENRDLSLTHSMISLGSCTMKLNAASELYPITNPAFANVHPFTPKEQIGGYLEMIETLRRDLSEITGFHTVSFQPNSGAQGEYAGLRVIRAYHEDRNESHRNIAIIPSSAHGTNPASAVMAGMKVVVVKSDKHGNIDVDDLRDKVELHSNNLGALMVTYPSTHGVFETAITEITDLIHQHGGLVYMDGANMNAQVGLTSPGKIGADVCHLNLHKTFAIPHGGGGPGMGPIGVTKALATFLPNHPLFETGGEKGIHAISGAPFGSSLILLISYAYIKMLGQYGVKRSTEIAILNANYIKARLEGPYEILYKGKNGTAAHELIVDCRPFKKSAGVEVEDIAKRLIDYGFHAPTVSFPVAGCLMIEPTESEAKTELDRFCDAMLSIRAELQDIADGKVDSTDNVLKNAPHKQKNIMKEDWPHIYSRQKAGFPAEWLHEFKFWPTVSRVDNAYGDRNLICTCPSMESYEEESAVAQ